MITYITTFKTNGTNSVPVTVETEITGGVGIHLVGLADAAVKESLLRTVTAMQSCGYRFPGRRVVINLAPADLRKSGTGYDLPIALGVLSASEQEDMPLLDKYVVAGELALDGSVRDIPGWIQAVDVAKEQGKGVILPTECARLAANAFGDASGIVGVSHLNEAIAVLKGAETGPLDMRDIADLYPKSVSDNSLCTWDNLSGGADKRALLIAAAGGHPLFLMGAPGSRKASLARALVDILPPMSDDDAMDVQRIYSSAFKRIMPGVLPFRAPHYSASLQAVLGGGVQADIVPGEVSLAHGGVLFLDEFESVPSAMREALRGPMEDGEIIISRLGKRVVFPASFFPVIAASPCPCGYYGEGDLCTCSAGEREEYLSRLSSPLFDRLTMQVYVPVGKRDVEGFTEMPATDAAQLVKRARERQKERQGKLNDALTAAEAANVSTFRAEDRQSIADFADTLINNLGMSVRAYSRILKIARTIADIEDSPVVLPGHLSEAASYRFLDRRF